MQFLLSYLKSHKKLLIISLVLATINQAFSLVNPQIFQVLIDRFANNISDYTQSEFLMGIGMWIWIWVAAALVSRIAKTFQDYYVNLMSQKIGANVYGDGIEHTFNLPYRVFEDRQSWSLLDKLNKARNDIQKFIQSMINTVFLTGVWVLIVMVYAFWVSRVIGTVFLVTVPILAWTTVALSKKVRQAQRNIVRVSAELAWATVENVKNVTLIKSLGLETQEITYLNSVNDKLINLEIEKLKLVKSITFWQWTLINLLRSILQFVMLWLVFEQVITVWEFFTLLFYSFLLFNPLYELPKLATDYQDVKASTEILQEIFAIPVIALPDRPISLSSIKSIEFTTVGFSYTPEDKDPIQALTNVSFSIKSGETIAFVGPSWAWKSTILKLITGLYTPVTGEITINNTNYDQLNREVLKSHLSIVAQDTQLFAWTVRENLTFVSPEANDAECITVLKQAQLYSLIEGSLEWLDTRIGEGGLKLSWGQKQRLAIARALLRSPDLLILDEATSSLDSIVEAKISDTVREISESNDWLLTIMVAHRLSTIMHADRIYVLEAWSIVESWSHDSLVEEKGLYYAMWRQQSGRG